MRTRDYRRSQAVRAKRRAVRVLTHAWDYRNDEINPRLIGVTASTHGAACSCWMCGNPRRYFGEVTIKERQAMEDQFYEG